MSDYEPYMDEGYEIESALGSAGMGTDEWYRPAEDIDEYLRRKVELYNPEPVEDERFETADFFTGEGE